MPRLQNGDELGVAPRDQTLEPASKTKLRLPPTHPRGAGLQRPPGACAGAIRIRRSRARSLSACDMASQLGGRCRGEIQPGVHQTCGGAGVYARPCRPTPLPWGTQCGSDEGRGARAPRTAPAPGLDIPAGPLPPLDHVRRVPAFPPAGGADRAGLRKDLGLLQEAELVDGGKQVLRVARVPATVVHSDQSTTLVPLIPAVRQVEGDRVGANAARQAHLPRRVDPPAQGPTPPSQRRPARGLLRAAPGSTAKRLKKGEGPYPRL